MISVDLIGQIRLAYFEQGGDQGDRSDAVGFVRDRLQRHPGRDCYGVQGMAQRPAVYTGADLGADELCTWGGLSVWLEP